MPITTNNLGSQFTVQSVSKTWDTDIRLNVIKRRENISYRSSVPAAGANIAYLSSAEVASDNNVSVADRSTSLSANRIRDIGITTISSSKVFSINTDSFVVTDIFTEPSNTLNEIPLFYKHVIPDARLPRVDFEGEDFSLDTGVTLVSLEILDADKHATRIADLKVDYSNGIIYSNLLSEFSTSSSYTTYYLKYTVNNNGVVETFVDLLDNSPVYRVATFDDLTASLSIIQDGRKVYLIEETSDGFEVTLPTVGTYSFQPVATSRIQALKPASSDITEPWFVRVTNGQFFSNIGGTLYKYHIAEFLSQVFSPEPPIKEASERSTILGDTLIKLDHENVNQSSDLGLYVNVHIYDDDGEGVAAFTTDDSQVGIIASNGEAYEKWSSTTRRGIRSIDHRSGFVEIEGETLASDWEVRSSYWFDETNYEFTLINFNPVSNQEALNTRISLFLQPDSPADDKDQSLYYLKIDESGKVFESNWDSVGVQLLIDEGRLYYERLPDFLTTESGMIGEPNYVDPSSVQYFIDNYTVEGTQGGEFLVLGDITVAQNTSVDQVDTIDTRLRGGGITEESYDEVAEREPEARWFWDEGYWDGLPYPGTASYMVEVPVEIMQDAGGNFTASEVRDIVERHTAFGVYPLVRAYGVDIEYTGYQSGSSVELQWKGWNIDSYSDVSPDVPLRHQFQLDQILWDDVLGHQVAVRQDTDVALGHEFNLFQISTEDSLGQVFNLHQISKDAALRHQTNVITIADSSLSHEFDTITIADSPLQHQFLADIPPPTIPMETFFSQVSGQAYPNPFSGSTFCSMSGFTEGDRYLVIANGGSNANGYGMHHQIRFSGVTDPNLQWYQRNRESSSGQATIGQTAYMMKLWTPGAGATIDWRVDGYDYEASSYMFDLEWPSILAMNMDSGGLVENTDWFYNEHNTPMYNISATYNDNIGAQITFTPDGTSDYLIIGSGQFFPDNHNKTPYNVQWMELSDSVSGFLCDDGYSKSDTSTTGSSHINNAMWILEAPSATSRTISLKFRSNSGYATYDYKHSALWIFRLNKSASYSYSQSAPGTDIPGTSETTLVTVPFTPASTNGLFFSRMAWYSSTQTIRHWQRMYWDGSKIKQFINSMPGWGSYSGTHHTSDTSSPLVATNQISRGTGLTPEVSKNLTVSHQSTQNTSTDRLFENCTVAFDTLMTQG